MERSLDAAVVIPSYREGVDVVHTLASIARQKGLKGRDLGVFVVVNNVRGAVKEVLDENRATAELVRALAEKRVPPGLSTERKVLRSFQPGFDSFGAVSISDREAAHQVTQAPYLTVEEVNLWEGENAPEVCNVGVARHLGTIAAIARLKDKSCPVMHRDADTILHPHNVATILDILARKPGVQMVRGLMYEFLPADNDPEALAHKRQAYCGRLDNLIEGYRSLLFEEKSNEFAKDLRRLPTSIQIKEVKVPMDKAGVRIDSYGKVTIDENMEVNGCDMNFPASLYDEIQFPLIPGEEDTKFAAAVRAAGHKIELDPRIKVAARVRFSQRATTGHGQSFIAYSKGALSERPYASLKADELLADLTDIVMNRLEVWPTHNLMQFTAVLQRNGIIERYGLTPDEVRTLFSKGIYRENGQIGIMDEVLSVAAKKFPSTVGGVLADLKAKLQVRANNPRAHELLGAVQRHEGMLHAFDSENDAASQE